MATGKTNRRWYRVWVDNNSDSAKDLSTAVLDISGLGLVFDKQDVTGYSDGWVNYTLGHPSAEVDMTITLDNTATTGAHTVLSAAAGNQGATSHTLTVQVGIKAVPASTNPEWEGEYWVSSYIMNGDGTATAHLVPASTTVPAWGTMA